MKTDRGTDRIRRTIGRPREKLDIDEGVDEQAEIYSEYKEIWKRFRRNKLGVLGLIMLIIIVFVAIFASVIAPYDPVKTDYSNPLLPPSWEHLFGTDQYGRDYFSRVIFGSQVSLVVGVVSIAIATSISLVIGSIAGYYKKLDDAIMRVLDIIFAFPAFFLALAILAYLGGSTFNAIIVIAIVFVPRLSRIVRAAVMEQVAKDYVNAAVSIGLKKFTILFRHILPNAIMPLIVIATLDVGICILLEASLSFLGMGTPPPTPTWGSMLADSQIYIRSVPHMVIIPGIAIMFVVMSFSFIGDGLRDALDPKLRA